MNKKKREPNSIRAITFSRKKRIYWGFATLGGGLINGIYSSMLSIFLTDYLRLVEAEEIIYILSIIYAVVNATNDPLVGIWSDRTRSNKGRRIPFMKYTAPFFGFTFILIWFTPTLFNPISTFIWLVITTALYDTSYTIIFLVYSALLPEITESEKERNKLQVWSSLFSFFGTIFGFIIPEIFRKGDLLFFRLAMIGVGILGSSLILFMTFQFKERPEFTQIDEPLGIKESLKYTFKSRSFIILVSANFFQILMQSLVIYAVFYFADYVLKETAMYLLIFLFIPLLLGIWITPKLLERFGLVKSDQILLLVGAIGLILLTFMPDFITAGLALAIPGIGFVGPIVFTNVLFAQVADEDEVKTGVRREGVFFGINALITKPAQSIALVIPTALLAFAQFVPRIDGIIQPQPYDYYLISIRLFTGLIPGLCLVIAAIILQFYPLKGEYWKEIQQKVLEMHEKKEKKLKMKGKKTDNYNTID